MKLIKTIVILGLLIGFLFNVTSCVVVPRKDNGKHKGWHKSSSNLHHLNTSKPSKSKK
jgi:hypothetical protein